MQKLISHIQDLYDRFYISGHFEIANVLKLIITYAQGQQTEPEKSAHYWMQQWSVAKEALKAEQIKNEDLKERFIRLNEENKNLTEALDFHARNS